MIKLIYLATIGFILTLMVGCANGPLSNWFKGAPCNTCQPDLQPSFGSQAIQPCTDGCQTPSAIPNQIIQPTLGSNSGSVGPVESSYYSANDPTTQSYETQPFVDSAPPVYGNIPTNLNQPGPAFGSGTQINQGFRGVPASQGSGTSGGGIGARINQAFGSGSTGNVLTPPSLNFSVNN